MTGTRYVDEEEVLESPNYTTSVYHYKFIISIDLLFINYIWFLHEQNTAIEKIYADTENALS